MTPGRTQKLWATARHLVLFSAVVAVTVWLAFGPNSPSTVAGQGALYASAALTYVVLSVATVMWSARRPIAVPTVDNWRPALATAAGGVREAQWLGWVFRVMTWLAIGVAAVNWYRWHLWWVYGLAALYTVTGTVMTGTAKLLWQPPNTPSDDDLQVALSTRPADAALVILWRMQREKVAGKMQFLAQLDELAGWYRAGGSGPHAAAIAVALVDDLGLALADPKNVEAILGRCDLFAVAVDVRNRAPPELLPAHAEDLITSGVAARHRAEELQASMPRLWRLNLLVLGQQSDKALDGPHELPVWLHHLDMPEKVVTAQAQHFLAGPYLGHVITPAESDLRVEAEPVLRSLVRLKRLQQALGPVATSERTQLALVELAEPSASLLKRTLLCGDGTGSVLLALNLLECFVRQHAFVSTSMLEPSAAGDMTKLQRLGPMTMGRAIQLLRRQASRPAAPAGLREAWLSPRHIDLDGLALCARLLLDEPLRSVRSVIELVEAVADLRNAVSHGAMPFAEADRIGDALVGLFMQIIGYVHDSYSIEMSIDGRIAARWHDRAGSTWQGAVGPLLVSDGAHAMLFDSADSQTAWYLTYNEAFSLEPSFVPRAPFDTAG